MTPEEITQLLSLIAKVVNGSGSWQSRADAIKAACSEDDTINLAEFSAWLVYESTDGDAA